MTPVDQYIYNQPDGFRDVLDFLHSEISALDPRINCTIKWKVPYYSRQKSLCYLNVLKVGVVELNFIKARIFDEEIKKHLVFRERKVIGGLQFTSLEEIDTTILEIVLQEAMRLDET